MIKHPTPEDALSQLEGLSSTDLSTIIRHAVDYGLQTAPVVGLERYYLAELNGFQYNFHYYMGHGTKYRLRDAAATWAIEFASSLNTAVAKGLPYVVMPLITTSPRACFDFRLEGDREQFRHDMTKLKLFL